MMLFMLQVFRSRMVLFIVESVYKSLEVFLDGAIYRGKYLQVFRSTFWVALFIVESVVPSGQ